MPQYQYQGINSTGKSLKGKVITDSLAAAKAQLRREGIFPSSIVEMGLEGAAEQEGKLGILSLFQRIPTEDLALMTRQLATLVGSHIPLVEALSALIDQVENPKLKACIAQIKSDVNEGLALSRSLARFPEIFNDLFVNMVNAGETSGALDIVLQRLADFLEYQDRLKKRVGSALLYPMIMLGVGFLAVIVIFTKVIPQMETMFSEMKQSLPLVTQIVLAISRFMVGYWWVLIFVLIITIESVRRFLMSDFGKRKWHQWSLEFPIFGNLTRMIAVSRFTKTLATLLQSGIPLLPSLKIVKSVVGNQTIQNAIEQATTDLTEGANIADPLKRSGQFPPLVTHMISVGEKTGELESMLEKVSEHYEQQVESKIQNFTSLIEPIMIIGLAVIVLVIVLSVVLPMLELNNAAL